MRPYGTIALAATLPLLLGAAMPAVAGQDDGRGWYGGPGGARIHDGRERGHDLLRLVGGRDHHNWGRSRHEDWRRPYQSPDRRRRRWMRGYGWGPGRGLRPDYGWGARYYGPYLSSPYRQGSGLCHCGHPFGGHSHHPPGRVWGYFGIW